MLNRCYNEKVDRYPHYGGRGIKVCDRWRYSFMNFYQDMGSCPDGMSIERENVDGDYEPNNCIWASTKTQSRNRTDTRHLTYNGQTKSLAEWSEITGIKSHTIAKRLDNSRSSWSLGQALGFEPSPILDKGGWSALRRQVNQETYAAAVERKKAAQRTSSAGRHLTYNGQTRCITEWAEITGIKRLTIKMRLDREPRWTVGQALGFEAPPPRQPR